MIADDAPAALEWESNAPIDGDELVYRGVTVIEISGGRITRSCAYFDPTSTTP